MYLGAGIKTPEDCGNILQLMRILFKLVQVKLLKQAESSFFPIPHKTNSDSILSNLALTLAICAAAKQNIPDPNCDDAKFCQAIYLVCICAAGGELSRKQVEDLIAFGASKDIAQLWNTFFQNPKLYNFGNLRQLEHIQELINMRDTRVKDTGTPFDSRGMFASGSGNVGYVAVNAGTVGGAPATGIYVRHN